MVYVNDKKFACESCIKGHRSSSCHHNDRPLFEIKKKGRPVSQCEKCRELRKTRRVHSKCLCNEVQASGPSAPSSSKPKSRRFVHIAPALPNGLQDALTVPESLAPADPRQKVESLLNPCRCANVWDCSCRHSDGLATLAQVATMTIASSSNIPYSIDDIDAAKKRDREISRSSSPTAYEHTKKRRTNDDDQETAVFRGPELPPLLMGADDSMYSPFEALPQFSTALTIPSMKSVASLAGTGCCCGFTCACPGCIEHRVPALPTGASAEPTSSKLKDCAEGCRHCVDNQSGPELPIPNHSDGNSVFSAPATAMESFFARAAKLPIPPRNRFVNLDPTNIMVFPTNIFSQERRTPLSPEESQRMDGEQARMAWGLVNVPKLDCCGGICGCPDDSCGCGKTCGGCCAADDTDADESSEARVDKELDGTVDVVSSCCGGK